MELSQEGFSDDGGSAGRGATTDVLVLTYIGESVACGAFVFLVEDVDAAAISVGASGASVVLGNIAVCPA